MWEQRASSSPEIRTVWRAVVDEAADYTDEASEHWGLSFIRRPDSSLAAELSGPRIERLPIRSRAGESYRGVELAAHVVIPGVDKALLRGAIAGQRRFRSVTGLRRKEIERLDRSRRAYRLLSEGMPPSEAAVAVGYADQAHLTRELRRIRGEVPARILSAAPG